MVSDEQVAQTVLEIYLHTGRIFLDGMVKGNILLHQGQPVCVDVDCLVEPNSPASQDYLRGAASNYPSFFIEYFNQSFRNAVFTNLAIIYLEYVLHEDNESYVNNLAPMLNFNDQQQRNDLYATFHVYSTALNEDIRSYENYNGQQILDHLSSWVSCDKTDMDALQVQIKNVVLFELLMQQGRKFNAGGMWLLQREVANLTIDNCITQSLCTLLPLPVTEHQKKAIMMLRKYSDDRQRKHSIIIDIARYERDIIRKPALAAALAAAHDYLNSGKFGFFSRHGSHGKQHTERFVEQLLTSCYTKKDVQQEMRQWIKGYDGRASNAHYFSRTAFAYASGVLVSEPKVGLFSECRSTRVEREEALVELLNPDSVP